MAAVNNYALHSHSTCHTKCDGGKRVPPRGSVYCDGRLTACPARLYRYHIHVRRLGLACSLACLRI